MIYEVSVFNKLQDDNYNEYVTACNNNGVVPQNRNRFNQFITFDYSSGFVADGNYPIYRRTKKELKQLLRIK
jgi:hypothetical protein